MIRIKKNKRKKNKKILVLVQTVLAYLFYFVYNKSR